MTTIDPMDLDRLADHAEGQRQTKRRTRRAEPITKRTAKNGAMSYEFRADVGIKPDGSRDRRRFTFRTLAEARAEFRRITSEVAKGTYVRQLDDHRRRGVRRVAGRSARHPARDPLQLRDGPETGPALPRRQEAAGSSPRPTATPWCGGC